MKGIIRKLEPPQWIALIVMISVLVFVEWLFVSSLADSHFKKRNIAAIEQTEMTDAKKYNPAVTTKRETYGKTTYTISYPVQTDGTQIASIQEQLDKELTQAKEQYDDATVPTWVYLKVYQSDVLKSLADVYYYRAVYQETAEGFQQTEFRELTHQLTATNGTSSASIAPLFVNDLEATNTFVKKAMSLAAEKHLTDEEKQQFLANFQDEAWKNLDVSILQNAIRLTIPESITTETGETVDSLTVGFQELFAIFKKDEVPESEQEAYAAYQEQVAAQLQEKRVAITFDDGPNSETTPQVLDILKKYGVHATFYIMGKHVAGNEALIQRMVEEGHELGNHSYSHPQLTKKEPDVVASQVQETQKIIGEASGGIKPTTLRPPYGSFNSMVAEQAGIALVNWSVDTLDWKTHSPSAIVQEVADSSYSGAIILMHDIHQDTVDALEGVIQQLQSDGYAIGSVKELMANQPMYSGYMYFDRKSMQPV